MPRPARHLGVVAGCFAFCSAVFPSPPEDPVAGGPDRTHRIPRAEGSISVDGVLDEEAWNDALRLELPYEVWPAESAATEVRTEAFLFYNDSHLFAGFRAHDPDPGAIRARLSDRDSAFQDDFVGLVVDTFNDERRAFEFFVNALGVQMDLVQDDVSGSEDSSWDAIWDSSGRLTESGYVVEMAIPYTSLRFQRGDGDQVWGLDLIRIYPRDQRYLLSMNPRDRSINCYLCQVGKVVGFEGATPGKNLEIAPTLTSTRTDHQEDFPDGNLEQGDPDYDPGLTVRWGATPNMTLSGTINPDFSQVEADVAQLDVNEQFALFFPEKRPFFLEGADFFDTPLQAVYTRTIADPEWGTKLTAKEGRNVVGGFVSRDELTNLLIPGSQSSSATSLDTEATAGVGRYRRDIGRNSSLGGLATVRESAEYHNRVAGLDTLMRPGQSDTLRIQALVSQTRYPEDVALEFDQPEGDFEGHAVSARYSRSTRNWSTWGHYNDLGDGFRSDLGFIPQVDIRQPIVGTEYRWWGDDNDWYNRFGVGGDWDLTVDQGGDLIERELEAWSFVSGPRQSFIFLGGGLRDRGYLDDVFDQTFISTFFEIRPTGDLYFSLNADVGDQVDFAFEDPDDSRRARQGDSLRFRSEVTYNIGRRARLEVSHELRNLEIDEGRLFQANLSQMRLAYQWNIRTFTRAIIQYNDVERNLDLYPSCVADPDDCDLIPEDRGLFGQFLFSYKINPQTAFFLGYTESQRGEEEIDLTRTDRTLFFKIGYAWVQ